MEGLVALLAVPDCGPLEDLIGADAALLLASGQGLHEVTALLAHILRLLQEVLKVVLHGSLVFQVLLLSVLGIDELHLHRVLGLLREAIFDVGLS